MGGISANLFQPPIAKNNSDSRLVTDFKFDVVQVIRNPILFHLHILIKFLSNVFRYLP